MSATYTTPATVSVQDNTERKSHPVRRATLVAGLAGTAATAAFAAVTTAAGVPFEIDGKAIPVGGFATMTVLGAVLGGLLLLVTNRYAAQPRRRFLQITVALTALSCVPSVMSPPDTASKIALVAAHVLAAVVIVPVLARNAHR
jgi:peptidoglycan/LPS O-acetylase OafA/YrhL